MADLSLSGQSYIGEFKYTVGRGKQRRLGQLLRVGGRWFAARRERAALATFIEQVDAIAPHLLSSAEGQWTVVHALRQFSRQIDLAACLPGPDGYGRRLISEREGHWSIAAIVLRPDESTPAHDHGGWGCALTVAGIERNQRFAARADGSLYVAATDDHPAGSAYVFSPDEVHQPVGGDPSRLTVALHFLVHGHAHEQRHHERQPE